MATVAVAVMEEVAMAAATAAVAAVVGQVPVVVVEEGATSRATILLTEFRLKERWRLERGCTSISNIHSSNEALTKLAN